MSSHVSNVRKRIVPEQHVPALLAYLDGQYGEWKEGGTRTIAAATGLTRHRVMETLDFLVREGVLEKQSSYGSAGSNGRDFYRINTDTPQYKMYRMRETHT